MPSRLSLRWIATIWILLAMGAGCAATWVWSGSQAAWTRHLDRAYIAGLALHDSLLNATALPAGVTQSQLRSPPEAPPGWRETRITLTSGRPDRERDPRLSLRIQSPDIQYPIAEIASLGGNSQAAGLASVTRTLARFCSEPNLFIQQGQGPWLRVDGAGIWGCQAAPQDLRLLALAIVAASLLILLGWVAEVSGAFGKFAAALRDHRARKAELPVGGVQELQQTAAAVNAYVAKDREALANRALVLSGVSHDLGTPATRLRLRTALIEDQDLRGKLEHDIDEMTGMIDGVLTYTRAEIGQEPFRELSLASLAEAVVADYQDVGLPVHLEAAPAPAAEAATLFANATISGSRPPQPFLMRGQPISLRRALTNLIDNALKYGREAHVAVDGNADDLFVSVTDRGSVLNEDDLSRLTEIFQRGPNAGPAEGVGLGLAIVSTIAAQHGGRLDFQRGVGGMAARLTLCRRWA